MSGIRPDNPLIVQGDHTILAEVASPRFEEARDQLARFAELIKAPEHVHTYRVTPLSIWNACAASLSAAEIIGALEEFSKYMIPPHVAVEIKDFASRYGRLKLVKDDRGLVLAAHDRPLAEQVARAKQTLPFLGERLSPLEFRIDPAARGDIKQALVKIGFPAEDLAGYTTGEALEFALRTETPAGLPFGLRKYQRSAVDAFHAGGSDQGGSGVITLPCGAGKTIVGMASMAELQCSTLILTTSVTAVRQWIAEILDKTTLTASQVGEYSGLSKSVKQVTIATYQIMSWRAGKQGDFPHLSLFNERNDLLHGNVTIE
ncbi:MAG: helicase-associated domain-containing protein, partial [Terriglobia bacterium]